MRSDLLFVYGTLKRQGHNHGFLQSAGFRGQAQTPAGFCLLPGPGYPYLLPWEADTWVRGELYQIPDDLWPKLDWLEDNGKEYQRHLGWFFHLASKQWLPAWVYLALNMRPEVDAHCQERILCRDGCFDYRTS